MREIERKKKPRFPILILPGMETKEPKGHDDKGRFLKGNRGNQFLFHLLQNPNLPRLRTIIRSYVRKENLNDARGGGKSRARGAKSREGYFGRKRRSLFLSIIAPFHPKWDWSILWAANQGEGKKRDAELICGFLSPLFYRPWIWFALALRSYSNWGNK